jgi:outer membrane immunogenic protein
MRRCLARVGVALLCVLASGTAGADGYATAARAKPALQQIWTGFYGNLGVGYGLWDAETTTDTPGRCVSCATTNHSGRGWLGEAGAGYDYQINERFVAGVLFNYDFSDLRGKSSDAVFTTSDNSNDSTWFIGVRAGWLMTPAILNYWSVGYTQTHFSGGSLHNSYTGQLLPNNARLGSYEAGGWFVGGGLEMAMHEGWFWRSEARIADYGNDVRLETGISPVFRLNFDPVVATATSGIVYKFDFGH